MSGVGHQFGLIPCWCPVVKCKKSSLVHHFLDPRCNVLDSFGGSSGLMQRWKFLRIDSVGQILHHKARVPGRVDRVASGRQCVRAVPFRWGEGLLQLRGFVVCLAY